MRPPRDCKPAVVDLPDANGQPTIPQPGNRPGVLVVDDEHLVRIMLQLGLEQYGFDVHLATDGHEAIKLYRDHHERIAVVLLDVIMPGLDGLQTLHALRELNPDLRACFMTGHSGVYEPAELLKHGAEHVVTKPFYLAQMANILRGLAYRQHADMESHPTSPATGARAPTQTL
jgi:CheY-like chemotaxis protein